MVRKRIINALLACFTCAAFILAGSLLFLAITHTKPFAVQSESMSPVFHQGDAVFVRVINAQDLRPGDIITVMSADSSRFFTHRITRVDLKKSLVYTKGDNNSQEDPMPADMSLIVGKVWFSIPLIGRISFVAQSRTFLISLAAMVVVLVFIGMVVSRAKTKKDGGASRAA